jgi:two-component system response regulator HydG
MVEALFIDPPEGRAVAVEDLPPAYRRLFQDAWSESAAPERERLVEALRDTNWNKVETARQMNWSRMTLYRKIAKYALSAPPASARDPGD